MELPINGFTCTRVFLIHVLIQIIWILKGLTRTKLHSQWI
jgi:hypothetical protein